MALHPQAAAVVAMLAELNELSLAEMTPTQARQVRAAQGQPPGEPVHEVRDVDADGIPCRLYRPTATERCGLTVFFHGGGWVIGDLDTHDGLCRGLANASGHALLSVDYRLAPEHPFPAAVDDAVAATKWAHAHATELGCDPERLAVAGDSAGGNLAAVVALDGSVPLRFQLLVYPVTDATMSEQSYIDNATGYFLTVESMEWFIRHYIGSPHAAAATDWRVSPSFASLEQLARTPQAMVITAEYDPLRDEGDAYAARLAAAGVPTSHVRFGGMFHGFVSLASFVDDGRSALALAGAALDTALSR